MNKPMKAKNGACLDFAVSLIGSEETNCIYWPFQKSIGYPAITVDGKKMLVSRFLCNQKFGPPREGDEAAHSCGNGHLWCVNPNHLRWATHAENEADKRLHGTLIFGAKHKLAKLSDDEVIQIRRLAGSGAIITHVAKQYGVSRSLVSQIVSGRKWRHLL